MIARRDRPDVFLWIPVTDRCQLPCRCCMPPDGVPKCRHEDVVRFEEIRRFDLHLQAHFNVRQVRLTGGDSLVRDGIEDLVVILSELGIPGLAMMTNGQRRGEMAGKLRSAGLRRGNISLDSLDSGVFRHLTRGGSW